ncbi:extensin-like [Rhagoletis pomonella]|uniref:extensin-like n=1 Tax=Rhagoletis pomonella TaxID=28610 RepID=UPI001785714E|nr:extensin-like [Rhagoletis pomonella]
MMVCVLRLRWMYTIIVRPIVSYDAAAWVSTAGVFLNYCNNAHMPDGSAGGNAGTWATKFFVAAVSFALLAYVAADVSHLGGGYNYPAPVHEAVQSQPIVPQNTYLPPPSQGYSYPAPVHEEVKSEPIVPQNTYIPPPPPPQNTYIPPAPVQEAVLSEPIAPPQNTYIPPPAAPQNTYIPPPAPVQEAVLSQPIAAPQNTYLPPTSSHGQDGYRYKTVRRVVYRRRF